MCPENVNQIIGNVFAYNNVRSNTLLFFDVN